jgi:D-glycero-D-manno-heptose 1,7-bisphosphate phosphatase
MALACARQGGPNTVFYSANDEPSLGLQPLPNLRLDQVDGTEGEDGAGSFCCMRMKKAIFLDRDGTIIFDDNYISDPAQVRLLPGAKEALTLLRNSDFLLFLFTNQSGVGRGFFPLETVLRCNKRMLEMLELGSKLFTDVCIAPESPTQPAVYRKPNPRFINEAIASHDIDRAKAWMVGDKSIDVQSGLNAGIKAALIGKNPHQAGRDIPCYESLLAFAQAVASQSD